MARASPVRLERVRSEILAHVAHLVVLVEISYCAALGLGFLHVLGLLGALQVTGVLVEISCSHCLRLGLGVLGPQGCGGGGELVFREY